MHRANIDVVQRPQPGTVLAYLRGVRVTIDQAYQPVEHGLTLEELHTFAEVLLRIARIPLLEDQNCARLHVTLTATKIGDVYSVHAMAELIEQAFLVRPGPNCSIEAAVWRGMTSFVANRFELREATRMELGKVLTEFMNEFAAANVR